MSSEKLSLLAIAGDGKSVNSGLGILTEGIRLGVSVVAILTLSELVRGVSGN